MSLHSQLLEQHKLALLVQLSSTHQCLTLEFHRRSSLLWIPPSMTSSLTTIQMASWPVAWPWRVALKSLLYQTHWASLSLDLKLPVRTFHSQWTLTLTTICSRTLRLACANSCSMWPRVQLLSLLEHLSLDSTKHISTTRVTKSDSLTTPPLLQSQIIIWIPLLLVAFSLLQL